MVDRILTGDRTTGPLHLGHYVGSLKSRVAMQNDVEMFVMLADAQALTDNAKTPEKVRDNLLEVACDYLAVGIDPTKSTIVIQSQLPALFELTFYYLNLVTWNRLQHNPTVKAEIKQKGFKEGVPAGFVCYPVSQAADITAFRANLVPVGEDQKPMIEQTNEVVRTFNRTYDSDALVECKAIIPEFARLPGIDGGAKMGKSLGNAIYLSDEADVLKKKVKKMYTDPNHLRIEDPGQVEGNPVFTYLDAFGTDTKAIQDMKDHYSRGGLGDGTVKKYLLEVLEEFLHPIRERRRDFKNDPAQVFDILKEGTAKGREVTEDTLAKVKQSMKIDYTASLFV